MKTLIALALLLTIVSCTKKNEPARPEPSELDVSQTNFNFNTAQNESDSFDISFHGAWSINQTSNSLDWLNLSAVNGTGNTTIRLTIKKKNYTGATRSTQLKIHAIDEPSLVQTITVSQLSNLAIAPSRFYGGTQHEGFYDIIKTPDGHYVAVGSTSSDDGDVSGQTQMTDLWVVKIDAEGGVIWERHFGGSKYDCGNSLILTSDAGYLIAGVTLSQDGDATGNHGASDAWLIKLDGNGNLLWHKTYGGSGEDVGYDLVELSNGKYVVAGSSTSNDGDVHVNNGMTDVWMFEVDANGNLTSEKTYGGAQIEFASSLAKTNDNGFIIGGYGILPINGMFQGIAIKINDQGTLMWNYYQDIGFVSRFMDVCATSDNGFVLVGENYREDNSTAGLCTKLDANGTQIWTRSLGKGSESMLMSIFEDSGGRLIAGGFTTEGLTDPYKPHRKAWVLRIAKDGNEIAQQAFPTVESRSIISLIPDKQGNYVAAGVAEVYNGDMGGSGHHGLSDAWCAGFVGL